MQKRLNDIIITHTTGSLGGNFTKNSIFIICAQINIGNFVSFHYCTSNTYSVLNHEDDFATFIWRIKPKKK